MTSYKKDSYGDSSSDSISEAAGGVPKETRETEAKGCACGNAC